MTYCEKCGVKLRESQKKCPLCETSILNSQNNAVKRLKNQNDRAEVRYKKNRYLYVIGLCFIAIMIISSITNLSISGNLVWARFVISSSITLWTIMRTPVKYSDRLHWVVISIIASSVTALFLLYLDYITLFKGWSLFCIASLAYANFAATVIFLFKKTRYADKITLIMLLSCVYLFLLDVFDGGINWSLYTIFAIILVWIFFILPKYFKKNNIVIKSLLIDSVSTLAYLFFVLTYNNHMNKFNSFALPLVLTFALPVIITYIVSTKLDFSLYGVLSLCFFFGGIVCLSMDYILNTNIFLDNVFLHQWSYISCFSSLIIAVALFIIEKNKRLQDYLRKKFDL